MLEESKRYDTDDITIIGGESIFRQLLPYCDTIEAAIIDYEYDADRHIDNIDKLISWQCYDESEEETYFDIAYHFKKYKKTIY